MHGTLIAHLQLQPVDRAGKAQRRPAWRRSSIADLKRLFGFASGDPLARANACLQAGDKAKAAEWFAKAGELKRAAALAAECGDQQRAVQYALRAVLGVVPADLAEATPLQAGELLLSTGHPAEALLLFELALAWKQAAEIAAKMQQPEKAARHYERARTWSLAAIYYEKAGRAQDALRALERESQRLKTEGRAKREPGVEEAIRKVDERRAAMLDRSGRKEEALGVLQGGAPTVKAARLLEQAGKLAEAIEAYLAVGDREEAQRLMRQLRPGSPEAVQATLKLVPVLVDAGKLDEANTRLNALPPETNPGGSTAVERCYWQARIAERKKDLGHAVLNYQKVVAMSPQHRDAARRLGVLRDETRTQLQAAAAPGGQPASGRTVVTQAGGVGTTPATQLAAPPRAQVASPAPQLPPTVAARPFAAELLAPGSVLAGRYDILAELGRGGMGRVYKAHDRELQEMVAIKTLVSLAEPEPAEEERLLREVQICRRLTHPNIVRVFDLGRFEAGIFVTMELVEGERLDQLQSRENRLALGRCRQLLDEILAGLEEAHLHQVVHRDLKPNNIMVTATRVKILDFGIARIADSKTRLTRSGQAIGTPMYMSPEQLRGLPVDGRSDLYALGVVAFLLLVGREPFAGDNPTAIAVAHLQQPAPDPRSVRPDLPSGWAELVLALLAKSPEERPRSAAQVRAVLAGLPG